MSTAQNGLDPMAYRPTSLDFINRPNPVEPHAVPEKHPLNSTPRLGKTSSQDLMRLLLDKNVDPGAERPAKRRKSMEAKLLDLPKLPVRSGAKRLRIPPTLSGLHQPPPDAGLLPSMSVQQPLKRPGKPVESENSSEQPPKPRADPPEPQARSVRAATDEKEPQTSKVKRKKWSEEETECLLKGVAKFGIGSWTKILNCPDYHFERRTALDLKDRFRVCCPDDYKTSRKPQKSQGRNLEPVRPEYLAAETPQVSKSARSDRKSSADLRELGIEEPFPKAKRRRRTAYTAAEDEALLKGFERHGNSWAAIRQDFELGLNERTATDLRDRFRTRYPKEYAEAGLAPRPEVFPKKHGRRGEDQEEEKDTSPASSPTHGPASKAHQKVSEPSHHGKENREPNPTPPKRQPPTSLFSYDDVFFGAPFDGDEADSERITLDRRILDWPSDVARQSGHADFAAGKGGIDPLETLKLPRPTRITSIPQSGSKTQHSGTVAVLPSVASITAGSSTDDFGEQLELPSLMSGFGALEADGRTGGHLMSLDELLS